MARKLAITWTRGSRVSGYLSEPASPRPTAVLLAHGAGAGQQHPFMVTVRDVLADHGVASLTFDYRYMDAGRRSPDRMELLLDVHEAAADRLATRYDRIALVGKSMGGRIGSHLVGDRGWPARAVAYLGYPLVPPGKAEPRATDHLHRIGVPQLFIAGTRDRLSPPDAIRAVAASLPDAAVSIVDAADHSLRVPKRTGLRDSEVLRGVVGLLAAWLERADQRRGGV